MAWTERYVRSDAAGGGNGTTDTNSGANGAWTLAEGITNAAAGMRLNVKAGTYANTTTTRTFATAGTTTAPVWWRGFKTTAGDQDTNNTAVAGTDIPSLTFSTGQFVVSGNHHILSNFNVNSACTTTGGALSWTGAVGAIYRCRIENTAASGNACALNIQTNGYVSVVGCWLKATSSANVVIFASSRNSLIGCVAEGGLRGVSATASHNLIAYSIFDSTAGDSVLANASDLFVVNCSFYAPTGNGVAIDATTGVVVANCYFENVNQASKAGINSTGGSINSVRSIGNAFFNCTANTTNITESFSIFNNGTLGSAAFTAPASDDFSIGTVARAIGFPGAFETESSFAGYLDVGAVQRQEPAGGGGGTSGGFLARGPASIIQMIE
jgi:hypothetical protein